MPKFLVFISLIFVFHSPYAQEKLDFSNEKILIDFVHLEGKVFNEIQRTKKDVYPFVFPVELCGKADFSGARFKSNIVFSNVHFDDKAFFLNCIYDSLAFFRHSIFEKKANFSYALFNQGATFSYARFEHEAFFAKTHFNKQAHFYNDTFNGEVSFYGAYFENDIQFDKSRFKNKLTFENIQIPLNSRITFDSTLLPDTISFQLAKKIYCEVDLTVANFHDLTRIDSKTKNYIQSRRHKINLYKAEISEFHIDYFHFQLFFPDQIPNDEIKTVYEGLLKNFKDRGQNDSYELLDIEYHDFILGKYSVGHLWNCYGYHKEWVFYWAGSLLLLFSLFTFWGFSFLINKVYRFEFFKERKLPKYASINIKGGQEETYTPDINKLLSRFWNRAWYSFVYTVIIFFLFSLKIEYFNFNVLHEKRTEKIKHILGLLYIILIYIAGIACLAYMANFVLQK